MTAARELARLARLVPGDPETALTQLLQLLCEQLGMERAVLGRVSGDTHTLHLAVHVEDGRTRALEGRHPAGATWCSRVRSDAPLVVRDDPDGPELARALDLRCYAGVVVRGVDGRELGVLGVASRQPVTRIDERDLGVLTALAEVVGELYPALLRTPVPVPAPRRPTDLVGLADVVSGARDLEALARPLLEALHDLSGIASTYLTVVHEDRDVQEVRYARNTKPGFALPEGLHVPWRDTLCKRALDQGRSCTTDVPEVWGDSDAGRELGIVTYVSVPVRLSDGRLWGTLCGADDVAHADAASHLPTLALFARLIASEVERDAAVERARREADTDPLTGCSSRRTLQPWLDEASSACRAAEVVALVCLDVDDLKPVNDGLGHAAGDALLAELGVRLRAAARHGDLVARLGGDEFVVAARVPRAGAEALLQRVRDAGTFALATGTPVRCSTGLATSDDAPDLLDAADRRMYRDKQRAGRHGAEGTRLRT